MEQPNGGSVNNGGGSGGVGEPTDDRSASPARATQNNNATGMGPLSGISNGMDTAAATPKTTNWVKFEEDGGPEPTKQQHPLAAGSNRQPVATSPDTAPPAVLPTETVHVNLDTRTPSTPNQSKPQPSHGAAKATGPGTGSGTVPSGVNKTSQPAVIDIPKQSVNVVQPIQSMRTIELSTGRVREGFANGDVIVTLLPTNTRWPWITPAVFRPELVPEELMAQGLTLTVEEYVHAMETLVNDYRFTLYNICYKRVLVVWILFAFIVLIGLLFSGFYGITLLSLGVAWLFLNAAAIFLCMWVKLKLARGLERCMARVNKQLIRHKILLALDDRGHISCHKVNLCFLYFEPSQCISYLNEFIERSEQNGNTIEPGWESRLDVTTNDIVIQGANTTRLSRKQGRAEGIFLRYLQRWGKDYLRRRLDWTIEENAIVSAPRHLPTAYCPCQYAEEVMLQKKPKEDPRLCCATERGMLLLLRYASRWGNEAMRGLIDVTPNDPARHCRQYQCPCQYVEYHLKCKPRGKLRIFYLFYWLTASERLPVQLLCINI
uniref:Transmembrane protein 268 n=1 Tax=Anopheles culicifacies TaxID=139723 RepID=A0A182MMS5_9DIPT